MENKNMVKVALKFGLLLPVYLILFLYNKIRGKENHKFIRNLAKRTRKHCGCNVKVFGTPPSGHFFICSNHRGYFDPVLISSYMTEDMGFAMKKELDTGVWRVIASCTGSRFLWRTPKEDIGTIKQMCDESAAGKNWCVFPEGTRNTKSELLEFSAGIFKIPLKGKCDIVPVVVYGTEQVIEQGINEHDVIIKFLEPITYENYKSMNTLTLSKYVRDLINVEYSKISECNL